MKRSRESKNLPSITKSGSNLIQREHDLAEVVVEADLMADGDSLSARDDQRKTTTVEVWEEHHAWKRVALYQWVLKGDWDILEFLMDRYSVSAGSPITRNNETLLHIASGAKQTALVEKLVSIMTPNELALKNKDGDTALCFAAASGAIQIARSIVEKNKKLLLIRGFLNVTPLFIAVTCKCKEMTSYLFSVTELNELTNEERIKLLIATIHSDFYDISLSILENFPNLATARDKENNDETALHVMAKKTYAMDSTKHLYIWEKAIYSWLYGRGGMKTLAHELVDSLWSIVLYHSEEKEILEFIKHPTKLLNDAATAGNVEFLLVLISKCPSILWEDDDDGGDGKSIFHVTVENRLENVFILINEIGGFSEFKTKYRISRGNYNILHLAAKLPASNHLNRVSGAALQMQRELLWFKEVEKIVLPSQLEAKCNDDPDSNLPKMTPRELFTEKHKILHKDAEAWMKNTANSCMLVATLISTIVFAAAFTVPGGSNDNTGTPIFQKKFWFAVFVISDAIALFSSSTSILMFLSILTSRYAEEDFIHTLPCRLLFGLASLFISIVCMVVAFSATLFMLYYKANISIPTVVTAMAIIPVTCFCVLQFKLWVDIFHNTYSSRFLFKFSPLKFL